MIATLLIFGSGTPLPRLAAILAWGSVAGSALQLGVQLPVVWRVAPDLRFTIDVASSHVRAVVVRVRPKAGEGYGLSALLQSNLSASLLPAAHEKTENCRYDSAYQ